MQQKDYIQRMVEQVAAAIARVLGFAREARFEEAEHELDAAWSSALGFRRRDALRLDSASLRAMLGAKAELAARLLEAQADLEDARGAGAIAEALRRQSSELRQRSQ